MQRWSETFIPTLKESPAEAEIPSHRLLLRAGLVRKSGAGIYAFLPLGLRALRKIEALCREELNRHGAMEVLLPAVHPVELWKRGPRWEAAREVMYRVDSAASDPATLPADPEYVLGPTHEEIITALAAAEIASYRDLPKNFYQIQTKFRNEIRPRFGLMRAREFIMKDGYSFDVSDEAAVETYERMRQAYEGFFTRCGLEFSMVEADTGVMGGSHSHEFMVPAAVGDDDVLYCRESGYASNRERARSGLVPENLRIPEPEGAVEEFPTPGVTTIADLSAEPYRVPADRQYKTLVYIGDGRPFLVVLRGCDDLEEAKLGTLGFQQVRPARADETSELLGAEPGSLGAVRGRMPGRERLAGIYADEAIRLVGNGTTGANRDGFHVRNIHVERDLDIDRFGDFRRVQPGEPCPQCGKPLELARAIEVGHIFKLGTKYSEAFEAFYTDTERKRHPMVMGCYGIGISRTLQAVIEQRHDEKGIIWPWNVAPFQVVITLLDPGDANAVEVAERLGGAAEEGGADVLLDDRDARPGVKFNDADLIGFPVRVVIGRRGLAGGVVELHTRHDGACEQVALEEAPDRLREIASGLQRAR